MSVEQFALWTGGWDSTFRIIQLYQRDVVIKPIYVIDHNRKSAQKEIETIELLTKKIKERFKDSKGAIHPPIFIKRKNIPSNPYLKFIYKQIKKRQRIGKQYYWLASLAKKYPNLEQCFHKEDRDQLISITELTEIKDETGGKNWEVNPKKMGFLKRQLFKNVRFPLCYISKLEMKSQAEEQGFIDILNATWFCHRSGDKPCGECAPCKQYVIDGFGYRLK
ncbi:hypothetical protein [Winogradskyella pulchriflava]|uniref:7-cyano-7-deazaguanine synthase n=1 Tax=Winogradskyella pulchriflava TaxID=1110688 RepID=A0ABV6QBX2_9FLAO